MNNNSCDDKKKCRNCIQSTIDILVILDFIVSTIGGFIKNSNENMANYCFMIGGGLLFIAVILIIYKYVKK
jgi:hypothetical protein